VKDNQPASPPNDPKKRQSMTVSELSAAELAMIAKAEIPVEHRYSLSDEPGET
jgi:hypothetical protein